MLLSLPFNYRCDRIWKRIAKRSSDSGATERKYVGLGNPVERQTLMCTGSTVRCDTIAPVSLMQQFLGVICQNGQINDEEAMRKIHLNFLQDSESALTILVAAPVAAMAIGLAIAVYAILC